jgi:autotransporter translocation and assembly factor TamB
MDTRDRKFGGHLAVEGASLTFFKTAIDSLAAKLNLKAAELEIEQLDIKRRNDSLSGQGRIDMSREHNYSGTLDARADNLLDYFPSFRGPAGKTVSPIPMDVQVTINSSNLDARGVIHVPDSSPISFTANFPLRIGTDWNAFQLSPLNVTFDFPSVFLAKAPQLFHPAIFQDGILSGTISLSETLQHPRVVGDLQLVNGKLSGDNWTAFNFVDASSRIAFGGNRASLEFLNVATKDVDLSLRGEIDFEDINDVTVRISSATPIFDLTSQQVDCVNKIKIAPAVLTLAPAVAEFEFRGGVFQSGWTVSLHEATGVQSFAISDPDGGARKFLLCLGTSPEEKTLLLGTVSGSETGAKPSRPKRQKKRR